MLFIIFPNSVFWLLFSILTFTIFPISFLWPSIITELKYSFLPKYFSWSLILFSTKTSICLFSRDLLWFIWFWNKWCCSSISLSFESPSSVSSKVDAFVPGRGLKIKENEFINFIFLTRFIVSLNSDSPSPGYPTIKSL